MKKHTAVEWLFEQFEQKGYIGKQDELQSKAMENNQNAVNTLFIGKIAEIIGFEKTAKILKECKNAIEFNPLNTNTP